MHIRDRVAVRTLLCGWIFENSAGCVCLTYPKGGCQFRIGADIVAAYGRRVIDALRFFSRLLTDDALQIHGAFAALHACNFKTRGFFATSVSLPPSQHLE